MPQPLMDGVGVRVSSEPPPALPFVIPGPKEEKLQFSGHKEQGKKKFHHSLVCLKQTDQ